MRTIKIVDYIKQMNSQELATLIFTLVVSGQDARLKFPKIMNDSKASEEDRISGIKKYLESNCDPSAPLCN